MNKKENITMPLSQQEMLTKSKIDFIKQSSFEDVCQKWGSIDLKNEKIIQAIYDKFETDVYGKSHLTGSIILGKLNIYYDAPWAGKLLKKLFANKSINHKLELIRKYKLEDRFSQLLIDNQVVETSQELIANLAQKDLNMPNLDSLYQYYVDNKNKPNFDDSSILEAFSLENLDFILEKYKRVYEGDKKFGFIMPYFIKSIVANKVPYNSSYDNFLGYHGVAYNYNLRYSKVRTEDLLHDFYYSEFCKNDKRATEYRVANPR